MRWIEQNQLEAFRSKHGEGTGLMGFRSEVKADTGSGRRDLVFIANTGDVDLENEVVVPGGLDWSHAKKNGSVFVDHMYDTEHYLGKLDRVDPIKASDGTVKAWKARVIVADTVLGNDMLRLAKAGFYPASSIGFAPIDRGPPTEQETKAYGRIDSIVRTASVLELSATYMPCNVACQEEGALRGDDAKLAALDGLVTKGLIRRSTADLLGVQTPPRRPIVIV